MSPLLVNVRILRYTLWSEISSPITSCISPSQSNLGFNVPLSSVQSTPPCASERSNKKQKKKQVCYWEKPNDLKQCYDLIKTLKTNFSAHFLSLSLNMFTDLTNKTDAKFSLFIILGLLRFAEGLSSVLESSKVTHKFPGKFNQRPVKSKRHYTM